MMKTQTTFHRIKTALALAALAALALVTSPAQTLKLSQEPVASSVSTNDDVLINATNSGAGTWTTKRATVAKVAAAITPAILSAVPGRTNPTFYDVLNGGKSGYVTYTNRTDNSQYKQVLDFVLGSGATNAGTRISFSQTPLDEAFGSLWVNTYHQNGVFSVFGTEWQIQSPGHFAFGPGWGNSSGGHIQIGIGGAQFLSNTNNGAYWSYLQSAGPKYSTWGVETKTTFSAPLTARCDGYFSAVAGTQRTFFPGIMSNYRTVATNATSLGIYEFDIFADLGLGTDGLGWGDDYSPATVKHQIRNFAGDHQATKTSGGLMLNWTNQAAGAAYVLDFSDYYARRLTPTTNQITWSTTNSLANLAGSDAYAKAVYLVRSGGLTITNTFPAWNTNGNGLPATIPPGKLMRLGLEWFSPGGETNVNVESAAIFNDGSYVVDADATSYSSRAGLSAGVAAAMNTFVMSLKSDGTWTNLAAIYPFASSGTSNALNVVSTNYQLALQGTILTNDATGFTPNGTNGYADTGFQLTNYSGDVGVFTWINSDLTHVSNEALFGARDSTCWFMAMHNGNINFDVRVNNTASNPIIPTIPGALFLGRSGSSMVYNVETTCLTQAITPCTGAARNLYIGAFNGDNTPGFYWRGRLQMVTLGRGSMSTNQYTTLRSATIALNSALGR